MGHALHDLTAVHLHPCLPRGLQRPSLDIEQAARLHVHSLIDFLGGLADRASGTAACRQDVWHAVHLQTQLLLDLDVRPCNINHGTDKGRAQAWKEVHDARDVCVMCVPNGSTAEAIGTDLRIVKATEKRVREATIGCRLLHEDADAVNNLLLVKESE